MTSVDGRHLGDGAVRGRRPTLTQAFGATFVALALVLGGLLGVFYAGSRRTLLQAADQLTVETSQRVSEAIEGHLIEAERAVSAFEAKVAAGLVRLDDSRSVEETLVAELVGRPEVSALSLTHAETAGFYTRDEPGHSAGDPRLRSAGRWRLSVLRSAGAVTRRLERDLDLSMDDSFTSPARAEQKGRTLWSDLYLPAETDHHRMVSVQKALWTSAHAVTVLRVSLLSDRIDDLPRVPFEARGGVDPLVFIADPHGHLVARLSPQDRVYQLDVEGVREVRVRPATTKPALVAALGLPLLAGLGAGESGHAHVEAGGERYLVGIEALPAGRTQDWLVGTVVPESYYLADLQRSMRRVLLLAVLLVAACLVGGGLVLRATRRDLGGLMHETTRLRDFDFAPSTAPRPVFQDVMVAADSLEQAKTALRALGKYAPLDLVRQLYEARAEPVLGGRVQDVSMVFSDIEGFTSVSEALPPDVLASALGRYLEAMTRAIHEAGGIIDKYTGDGVMALWNTPRPLQRHPASACAAVLACVEATERLFASDAWAGLHPWRTRFGIHRADVTVGHFGAPDRMSYTVMGDGVNLASRLEGLNKQYGTRILVSAEVEREARDSFWFRRLDRVAVKGKHQGVEVYELLGRRRDLRELPAMIANYDQALAAYFDRRFDAALALLATATDDRPSQVLAARCRALRAAPPPAEWAGVYVAKDK